MTLGTAVRSAGRRKHEDGCSPRSMPLSVRGDRVLRSCGPARVHGSIGQGLSEGRNKSDASCDEPQPETQSSGLSVPTPVLWAPLWTGSLPAVCGAAE